MHDSDITPHPAAAIGQNAPSRRARAVDDAGPSSDAGYCDSGSSGRGYCDSGSSDSCLSENVVVSLMAGQTSEAERALIEAHLDRCTACAELVFAATEQAPVSSRQQPWPATFAEGTVLCDRFTIWRFVARGGMGEVYEAFDRKVPERVALKTVLSTLSDNHQAVRHLCEEVKLARRVAHRHVCRIHELHEHREEAPSRAVVHFLAMEFVDGETLKARLARGPLPAKAAGRIARQLLEGLGAAHAAGVLHLDFKSQNVMLRAGVSPAEAVIMDFSLSRALDAETRRDHHERYVIGSPGYMSPEQLECRTALGPASDFYSFGVVVFEMLTGRLPFHGERAASMMALQLERPPPLPSQALPGLTPVFDSFVAKCLARDPADRFPDATSALAALDRCLARPLDRAARRRLLARRATRAFLVMLPIALGAALSQLGRGPSAAPAAPAAQLATQVAALTPASPRPRRSTPAVARAIPQALRASGDGSAPRPVPGSLDPAAARDDQRPSDELARDLLEGLAAGDGEGSARSHASLEAPRGRGAAARATGPTAPATAPVERALLRAAPHAATGTEATAAERAPGEAASAQGPAPAQPRTRAAASDPHRLAKATRPQPGASEQAPGPARPPWQPRRAPTRLY